MLLRGVDEEVSPHSAPRGDGEFLVVGRDVDAGDEGKVKSASAVGCEEHGAFEVFKDSQEHRDELVAFELVEAALFQENVGLVQE